MSTPRGYTVHSLITECFSQIFDTGRAISLTYVTFHVECSGIIQYFNFFCTNVIRMKKNLNYLVKPHERFPFGSFYSVNGLLPKKTNLQHCQLFQITSFDFLSCLSYSSRRLVVFFH